MVHWEHGDGMLGELASYKAYLESELWKDIRRRVFKSKGKTCWACRAKSATCVHHGDYSKESLLGSKIKELYPLCRHCHKDIHRDASLKEANIRMCNKRERASGVKTMRRLGKQALRKLSAQERLAYKDRFRLWKKRKKMNEQIAKDKRFHERSAKQWR